MSLARLRRVYYAAGAGEPKRSRPRGPGGTAAGAAEAKCCLVGPRNGMSGLQKEHSGSEGLPEPLL